jgi:hypothetical protein
MKRTIDVHPDKADNGSIIGAESQRNLVPLMPPYISFDE